MEAPPERAQERGAGSAGDDAPQPQGAHGYSDSAAPYLDRKLRDVPHLAEVWSYINPFMLYGRHLGYKGNFEKDLAEHDPKALELFHNMEELKQEAARVHEGEGGLAVLRGRARRQRHPSVRARRRGAAAHLPLRPPADARTASA